MRLLSILFLAIAVFWSSPSLSSAADPGFDWNSLAGMEEELEGERLELRDELIAAHLAYITALEKALAQVGDLPADDARLAPAWARVEYLLETAFRLLSSTGEHQAFLKATESVAGGFGPPPEARELTPTPDDEDDDGDGGLTYEGARGERLIPARVDGDTVLIDPATAEPAGDLEAVAARSWEPIEPGALDYIQLIKARAAWLRALALERLGRTADAGAETAGMGLIRDWVVLGPLDSESETYSYINYSLDDIYASLDALVSYPGKDAPVGWRPFTSVDPLGRIYLESIFRSPGMKSAMALALVYSPEDAPAVMRFGSNAPATVCVNHIQVRRTRFAGLPDPDQDAFNVWLRKGWNTVLVRTASAPDGWVLAARLTGLDGSPYPGHIVRPDDGNLTPFLAEAGKAARRSRLERFYKADFPPDMGGVSILSEWVEHHDRDARANFYLASFLVAKRMMEGPERFDRELIFSRATEYSDGDPFFTLMAARSVDAGQDGPDREENLRLVLLKTVADQGSAAALVDIGRLYLDVMRQPRHADEYAELALEANPMSLRAGVLDYDVAVNMGWRPVAKTLLQRLAKRHPAAAAARLRLGRAALDEGHYRLALGEFHAILAADAVNAEALDGAVVAMGMLGQTSAAVELLVRHLERFPYDFRVRLKLAELYRALGRDDDARAVLEAALAMAPDDPDALAMRRDILRETYAEGKAKDEDEGRAALRQELDLSPPKQTPGAGWEYLYFQVEDRMDKSGSIRRAVSFALRIYTDRAARMLRHLGFWLERDFESGTIQRLELVRPDGSRETFTPPVAAGGNGGTLKFYLPPLATGMTVEAEVIIQRERIPFLGDYFGQIAPLSQQAPIRLSRYMFTSPRERRLYFRAVNGAPEAMEIASADGQEVTRIWEMSNLPAYTPEPYAPGQHEMLPCVQISSFKDWNEFARWYWRLIGVQYHSPPELRLLARSLAGGETLPLAKLDRAADWVSRNIAHRDWEYGPYAFRPINARSILSRLSADGKDRTLLLCLLAREYGLEAWPVLARFRNRRFSPSGGDDLSLPLLDHFNHSLAMVESTIGGKIFLDASNPFRPSGVMPSQLSGSPGVVVTPLLAERIVIPDARVAGCEWEETAELVVDEDGSIIWEQTVDGTGTAAEMLRMRFRNRDAGGDPWSDFLASLGGVPSAASDSFHEYPTSPASSGFNGRVRLRRWASVVDNRVIMTVPGLPGMMRRGGGGFTYPLSLAEMVEPGERDADLVLPYGFRVRRRINVRYPENWRLVNPSPSFSRRYDFGAITLTSETGTGTLALDIVVEVPVHRLEADEYEGFREMAALAHRWIHPLLVWEKP